MPWDLSGRHDRHHRSLLGHRRGDRARLRRAPAPPSRSAARRADRIDELAQRIEDEGGRAVALPTDVADERQARAFVEHAYEQLGGLDASSTTPA